VKSWFDDVSARFGRGVFMSGFFSKSNLGFITLFFTVLAAAVGGGWTVYAHFHPTGKGESGGDVRVTATCGAVAIGGSASGATITTNGASAANCAAGSK